jgi:hypothetical protein
LHALQFESQRTAGASCSKSGLLYERQIPLLHKVAIVNPSIPMGRTTSQRRREESVLKFSLSFLGIMLILAGRVVAGEAWSGLAAGLDLGRFKASEYAPAGDSIVTVLRIDPKEWEFRLLAVSENIADEPRTAKEWCSVYGLTAAINAGMFNTDNRSHTGYMKCGNHTNNGTVNSYKSAAAFNPIQSDSTPFHIFDLDTTNLRAIRQGYSCIIQNLRLIDRQRTNRWSPQEKRWSEAALGEDSKGRMLFIYCRSPYSMHDFNQILLSLPIDLVCAQHLEGGPEAQLYVHYGKTELELFGSYESAVSEDDWNSEAWPIPNVIGIVKRGP